MATAAAGGKAVPIGTKLAVPSVLAAGTVKPPARMEGMEDMPTQDASRTRSTSARI